MYQLASNFSTLLLHANTCAIYYFDYYGGFFFCKHVVCMCSVCMSLLSEMWILFAAIVALIYDPESKTNLPERNMKYLVSCHKTILE